MMTEEQIQKARTIFQHYGLDNQLRILQEECAELIQAVSKYQRAQDAGKPILQAKTALMEEVADVSIMITQIVSVFSGKALSTIVDSKLDRQLARISKEG